MYITCYSFLSLSLKKRFLIHTYYIHTLVLNDPPDFLTELIFWLFDSHPKQGVLPVVGGGGV